LTHLLVGLALIVAAPAPKDPPKAPAEAEHPLVGEWILDSHISSGKRLPDPGDTFILTKDRWVIVNKGARTESLLAVDTKKDPRHIDVWVPTQGEENRARGIFKLEGDTLTVCYTLGPDRPIRFESPPKSGLALITLKRVKKD